MKSRILLWVFVPFFLNLYLSDGAKAADLETRKYKRHIGDIYETVDGTVFKKTSFGYVGNLGYQQELVFLSSEEICMNGSKYQIKIHKVGSQNHYSISNYSGADAYSKHKEICGDL